MATFTLYSIPGSPYGRAVQMALLEKGLDYHYRVVRPQDFKVEPHLSRHCFGKVPAIAHGDFMLYETQAILRYIDRVCPLPALTPTSPQDAARMDQVMNVNDCYLFRDVSSVIAFERVVGPRVFGSVADEAAILAAMPRAHRVFDELARLLGAKRHFTGADLSLADVLVAGHLNFFYDTPEWDALTGHLAGLTAWFERMRERDSFKTTTWSHDEALACI